LNLTEFYPTPPGLAQKMLDGIDVDQISTVLEPSAGKGDLAKAVTSRLRARRGYNSREDYTGFIDCVEIDANLRHILKGHNYRVVHDDFLSYHTRKAYDLIVMNPPFSDGDKHLMKALEIQQYGGQIRCLLNAETLRNPYTNLRKALVKRLDELNADIEYMSGEFESAERKTSVEIALVKVDIPNMLPNSIILDSLEKAKQADEPEYEPSAVALGDFFRAIVDQYRFEVDAGVRLIREYTALLPYTQDTVRKESYKQPILELKIRGDKYGRHGLVNGYIRAVRYKFWEALFKSPEFTKRLTNNLQTELSNRVDSLADYEFSFCNIRDIQLQLSQQMVAGVEDTILKQFDEFSHKHSYLDETSKNIHYYDGWKTNSAWKINKKVIIPFYGALRDVWGGKVRLGYDVYGKMADIAKVFDYLSGSAPLAEHVRDILTRADERGQSRDIELGHFKVTFFKKGTAHITFLNSELLDKFNIFGSQRKGWLPPSYGKRKYKDLDEEERAVIDAFEGEMSYNKVAANPDKYLIEPQGLLQLGFTE